MAELWLVTGYQAPVAKTILYPITTIENREAIVSSPLGGGGELR